MGEDVMGIHAVCVFVFESVARLRENRVKTILCLRDFAKRVTCVMRGKDEIFG